MFTRKKNAGLAATIGGGAIALAVAIIGPFEGLETKAYKDIVGIWTVCYGETRGVQPGQTHTKAECDAMLGLRVAEFDRQISRCLPSNLPDPVRASFVSLAYNIGSTGFCNSSISRRALQGDLPGACDAILLYNKARVNGKLQEVRGLTRRRQEERALCHTGLGK